MMHTNLGTSVKTFANSLTTLICSAAFHRIRLGIITRSMKIIALP
jgi:hypothetical protein